MSKTIYRRDSISKVFKKIYDNYGFFSQSPIKDNIESQSLDTLMSNVKHHEAKISDLKKAYKSNPSDDIKKKIEFNENFKNFYKKQTVVLYSRYFINSLKKLI
jgi:hypothetical protein